MADLLDAPDDLRDRLRQLRSRGHDVVLFHLLDPDEVELPYDDLTHFEGMEPDDERRLLCDPRDLAVSFRRESLALRERWRLACLEARVEYLFATTDLPPARRAAVVPLRAPAGAALAHAVPRAVACCSACAAAILPWLIHRIGKRRANPVRFAAMELLLRAERKVSARRRLREILLLLLRTAIAAALPLVFAKPFAEIRSDLPAATTRPQSAVIVLDDSASLRRTAGETGGDQLFEQARAQARVADRAPVS